MRRELFAAGCCAALAVAALGDGLGGRDKARPSQRTPVRHVVLIGVDGLDVAPTVAGLLGLKPPRLLARQIRDAQERMRQSWALHVAVSDWSFVIAKYTRNWQAILANFG